MSEAVVWRDMASAPKDGTLLALLVRPYANDEDGAWTPFEDSRAPQPTIGFNNFDDTGEDRWQFAGWSWCHDTIVEGHGEVMGWRPFGEKLPSVTPEETVLAAIAEWGEGPCDDLEDLERRVLSCLSTHTAAGAGPVGEAVVGAIKTEGFAPKGEGTAFRWIGEHRFTKAEILTALGRTAEEPGEVVAIGFVREAGLRSLAEGNHTRLYPTAREEYTTPVYARPVEPGEVERLTRENNRLTDAAVDAEAALAESEQNAQGLASDLAGTQAELAETRERLEKETKRIDEMFELFLEKYHACDAPISTDDVADYLSDVRRAVAALTGDAQEAGK